jgi:hypothetical protein
MSVSIVVMLITGWVVISALICLLVCMSSARFSRQIEAREAQHAGFRTRHLRAHRADPLPRESGIHPADIKAS